MGIPNRVEGARRRVSVADEGDHHCAEVERAHKFPLVARAVRLLVQYFVPQPIELGVVHFVLLLKFGDVFSELVVQVRFVGRLEVVEHRCANYQIIKKGGTKYVALCSSSRNSKL
ncbi:hypothetical protein BpHYR1_012355 [Brachionus plicatilis]|uniref:Uncharacterized protein n=1 Tax=Brachionus plicatilis TaxID=10195 RepID=A0A3M7Q4H0_BRAPC|nr:hypothetical protein BpHYR1_012355 [Brachionus plicatilis]